MGKRNRERRAEKRRAEARRARRTAPGGTGPLSSGPRQDREEDWLPPLSLDDSLLGAAEASWRGATDIRDLLVDRLPDRYGAAELSCAVSGALQRAVRACWEGGWQPADLLHVCARRLEKAHRQVTEDAIALESRSYRASPGADPEWLAQLPSSIPGTEDLTDGNVVRRWTGYRLELEVELEAELAAALCTAVDVLGWVSHLPRLAMLRPPPSRWGAEQRHRRSSRGSCDPKMTERVRALLAKAESTTFPEEAEALTAKAQELISKYAIDRALLEEGAGGSASAVEGRRILVDDPYASSKAILVSVIARANRCKSVWSGDFCFSTVFGHAGDLDDVEMLHASLLTQMTSAMLTAGKTSVQPGRTRSFRASFIVAFAFRIGERLQSASDGAVDEARESHGERLLPVLVAREQAVGAARDEAFPDLKRHTVSTSNAAGWVAGRLAADRAHLGPDGQLKAG